MALRNAAHTPSAHTGRGATLSVRGATTKPTSVLAGLQLDNAGCRSALKCDFVNAREERELGLDPLLLEHSGHVLACDGALQLLPVEKLLLNLIPLALALGKSLSTLAVAAAETSGDEVGEAARLHESLIKHALVKHLGELGGLLEADADDGSLGVAAHAETVAEARSKGDDVFKRATQLSSCDVVDLANTERGAVEQALPDLSVGLALESDRGLAKLVLSHIIGDVGTHEHRHVHAVHDAFDVLRDELRALLVELNALDEGDSAAALAELDVVPLLRDELVRHDKDQHSRVLASACEVRISDDVLGELDALEVLDILMLLVDDFGQIAAVNLLLVHPHAHLILELLPLEHVAPDDLSDC
mmetsp:Transcript_1087/g.2481  ORF Transcript_1087/g.2481 Transcript_1087/m.2481 type:complete len:360 (+) Transcript_1087:555-1634(+)